MADDTFFIRMSKFSGLNDVDDPIDLSPERTPDGYYYPLTKAQNIIITNKHKIVGRDGMTKVVSATSPHSGWSDGEHCFFVEGTSMYYLNEDYSITELRSGLAYGSRVSYVKVNDRVYYTNASEIGYIDLTDLSAKSIDDPDIKFKRALPPGEFIEFYRGILYVLSNDIIWHSDVLADYHDVRKNFFQIKGKGTMLRAVDNGIYVGGDFTGFFRGDGPETFEYVHVSDGAPIPYTDAIIDGRMFGVEKGRVAVWVGTDGLYIGNQNGETANISEKSVNIASGYLRGAGIIRKEKGQEHYIGVMRK